MLDPYYQVEKKRKLKALRNYFYFHVIEKEILENATALLFTSEQELNNHEASFGRINGPQKINIGYTSRDLNAENQKILEELQSTLKEVEDSKMTFEVQNRELNEWKSDNIRLTEELKVEMVKSERARVDAETAKQHAENDLDVLQKKTQFELINTIVKVALYVIIGVGLTTTALYTVALFTDQDTQIIGSTWSNMFGILLTNAFSIVGTIMGVKYASEKPKKN
jgi:hypothetical protein